MGTSKKRGKLRREPGTPWGLKATNPRATQVTLEWKEPERNTKEGLSYTVKYFGTKTYNKVSKMKVSNQQINPQRIQ
ncbi:hypothetical protein OS493_021506 [Desmophyllum pertusum]|uniref:Fibronectin type-III domain-containing protein n=1 Tax=Desmophyllum pertusum TaxID=174260 RepID=A0A9W9YMI1_9CNID|nr:hypothetical protein OS493_021506 [Desmophyllum pertusum]